MVDEAGSSQDPLTSSAKPVMLGELLIERGLISNANLESALELQKQWGTRLGDILISKGWIQPYAFYRVLADS